MSRAVLWAPWRSDYIRGPKPDHCVFCSAAQEERDDHHRVVCRGRSAFAILNRFPYTAGHLMVVPYRHVDRLEALSAAEGADLWALLLRVKTALDAQVSPDGYNIGMNLGPAAGAGIADHLHLHVVPRWVGDTNFMPVLGEVQVVSQHLDELYRELSARLGPSGT